MVKAVINSYQYFALLGQLAILTGVSVSCIKGNKFYMGYMSFPLMSLTVFVLLIILITFSSKNSKS